MLRHPFNQQDWNEFQWEREIRKDEKRINQYFKVLPNCLDLPGEEDTILKKLMAQPDLVPTNADWNGLGMPDLFFDEDDEQFNMAELSRKKGSDLFIEVQKLAIEWNIVLASDLRDALLLEGMKITCQFGKLLSRSADIVEIEDNQMPALKISLGKRMLTDLNDLVGMLRNIKKQQTKMAIKIDSFIGHIQYIREKTIDTLTRVRGITDKKQ
jgi:hypothetical protein